MKKRTKVLYFVTMVIKYTEFKVGLAQLKNKVEKITIFQKIQKIANSDIDAYQKTLLEAQQKFQNMRLVAYTITELHDELFNISEEDEASNKKIEIEQKIAQDKANES